MSRQIGEIFSKYREQIAQRNQFEQILKLREDSDFGELFGNFPSNTLEKYIYWMILLFKKLEEVEPPRPRVDHKSLCSKFKICIDKILEHNNEDEKSTLLDCVDEILSNELRSCSEISNFISWINVSKELTKSARYESMLYKKIAFLYSTRWIFEEFKNLSNLENVPQIVEYLFSIHDSGVKIKELNHHIADYVIEYIESKYLNNSNSHNSAEFKNAYQLIEKYSKIIESVETKTEIKRLYDMCVQIKGPEYFENFKLPDKPFENHLYLNQNQLEKDESSLSQKNLSDNITVSFCNAKLESKGDVFVKTYISISKNADDLKIFNNEISILETLSQISKPSNCFLEYFGTIMGNFSISLVMPRISQTLKDFIEKKRRTLTNEKTINQDLFLTIARKLVTSFECMIEKGISHQDIKPENILIDDSSSEIIIKIIDFNVSLIRSENVTIQRLNFTDVKGTYKYLCPQRKLAHHNSDKSVYIIPEKSDVYSLGLVFVELITLMDIKERSEIDNKLNELRFFEDSTKGFIKKMLIEDPEERVDFKNLIQMINSTQDTILLTTLSN